jgi:D-arabinose 1-dehydrogenase-like Zn-dependent alcohol dehydrogenase
MSGGDSARAPPRITPPRPQGPRSLRFRLIDGIPVPRDVSIEILFCGICHSDIHSVRDEWDHGNYPMVPGHEIVGRVSRAGVRGESRFKPGNLVGVGCFVDSCRNVFPLPKRAGKLL